jgi:arylsulfatase A-like enzyme
MLIAATVTTQAETPKPNIVVIFGDDAGITSISAHGRGVIGYQTPNIDRIARKRALFTDYYGQQSCTAGRAAFITGQIPFLKPPGYATGQFVKNHLCDRDEGARRARNP